MVKQCRVPLPLNAVTRGNTHQVAGLAISVMGHQGLIGMHDDMASLRLGSMLHLSFFDVAGCILVLALALMWLLVGKRTVQGAYRGELFVSPCIAGLKK